ncbi:MAG: hypothetical protein V4635_14165 [Bacteroidota bacterium]
MKNRVFLSAMLCGFLLLAASCRKPGRNLEPEPDTEFQSSIDVSYAGIVITDIDMICSFIGQNDYAPKFYSPAPCNSGTITASRNGDYIFIAFNNTKCLDGRVRDGSIAMYTGFINPNAKYYHDYEFQGKVSLLNYKVDGWAVELKNSFVITNKLTSPAFNPAQTNLSWSLNGDFVLKHPTDSNRNIHCNANLVKTLANTGDINIYHPKILTAISWSLATVRYTGTMFGETSRTVPFKYNINETQPLVRDFTCVPDRVSGTGSSAACNYIEEFHPFKDGRVTLTTSDLYPRDLSYGNEQNTYHDVKNSPLVLTPQCDNKGIVTIKGISYPVDFAKDYK